MKGLYRNKKKTLFTFRGNSKCTSTSYAYKIYNTFHIAKNNHFALRYLSNTYIDDINQYCNMIVYCTFMRH